MHRLSGRRYLASTMDIGNYLRRIHDHPMVYGITDYSPYMGHEGIILLSPAITTCDVPPTLSLALCPVHPVTDVVFILGASHANLIPTLEHHFPSGTLTLIHTYNLGQKIYAYRVLVAHQPQHL